MAEMGRKTGRAEMGRETGRESTGREGKGGHR